MKTKINWHEDTLKLKRYAEIKVKCKHCGHTNVIPVFVEEKICSWCKRKMENNSLGHFKYNVIKLLKKGKQDEKTI